MDTPALLRELQEKAAGLQKLQFSDPGIFTNAIITKPPITKLLKDAAPHEQALYKITTSSRSGVTSTTTRFHNKTVEVRPERVDGKSVYVDQSFDEYVSDTGGARRAVHVPRLVEEAPAELLSPTRRHTLLLSESGESVPEMCTLMLNLIQKYPSLARDGLHEEINQFQHEYTTLTSEINELDSMVEKQRSRLSSQVPSSPTKEVDIDHLIAAEEAEIQHLERLLDEQQA